MARAGVSVVTRSAPSIEDAHEIVGRLTAAGFARNSIKVEPRGDTAFEVLLHVRQANRARAERAIGGGLAGFSLGALASPGVAIALGVGAAALGAGIFAALSARKMIPRYLRDESTEAANPPREG